MKNKSPGDLMQDPFYSRIMLDIETLIYEQDQVAQSQDFLPKDTDVKSAIRKALGILKGKPPKTSKTGMREEWIQGVAQILVSLSQSLESAHDIEVSHYRRALLAVEDSLKTRREMYGHSRGYLDFLQRFINEQNII